jgi:hypothetical protein
MEKLFDVPKKKNSTSNTIGMTLKTLNSRTCGTQGTKRDATSKIRRIRQNQSRMSDVYFLVPLPKSF